MTSINVAIDGLEQAQRLIRHAGTRGVVILQQSLNRAGNKAKGVMARRVQEAVPVKLAYIRKRIVWRNADVKGTPGRLRFYGSGKRSSAWIRPRHMKPSYPTDRPSTHLGLGFDRRSRRFTGNERRRAKAISYGVGGAFEESARRSVLRGFVASVHGSRRFRHPWQPGFDRSKAGVFHRLSAKRLPISNVPGITVGEVGRRLGLAPLAQTMIAQETLLETKRRLDVELAGKARKT